MVLRSDAACDSSVGICEDYEREKDYVRADERHDERYSMMNCPTLSHH